MQADCTRKRQRKERGVITAVFDFENPTLTEMNIKKLKIMKRVNKAGSRYVIFKDVKKRMCNLRTYVYIKINYVRYFKFGSNSIS